jgi:hypothetical protein
LKWRDRKLGKKEATFCSCQASEISYSPVYPDWGSSSYRNFVKSNATLSAISDKIGSEWVIHLRIFPPVDSNVLKLVCMVWYGMIWYGMVWYGTAWHGMVFKVFNISINEGYSKYVAKQVYPEHFRLNTESRRTLCKARTWLTWQSHQSDLDRICFAY